MLGLDVAADAAAIRSRVGYLPEHDCLPPDVSASDFVVHLAMMSGLPRVAARERAAEVLRHVGLAEERYRPMGGYSTGMKQRAKLAQAIAHDPRLVLLDEPTNGLDPAARDDMLGLVQRVGQDFGISVLVTSHLLGELERVSDHVVILDSGRLLRASETRDFLNATGTLLVEVLGDDAQARMGRALAAAGVPVQPRGGLLALDPPPTIGPTVVSTSTTSCATPPSSSASAWSASRPTTAASRTCSPMSEVPRTGVIHDLGYRPYDGPRAGSGAIATALFLSGFRNAFGLGRSGKSKVLPFLLLALNLLPAVIIVGAMTLFNGNELPLGYSRYASATQILLSIFVAAQAPVLFSRDLRHGSIALYLARPLPSAAYAIARWAALLAATLVFLLVPIVALYVGAVLAELDFSEQTEEAAKAALLAVLLALMLTGIGGLIASVSVRRGFAVVATIAVLLLGNGVVTAIQGISEEQGELRVGEVAGLFSPYSLYRGGTSALTDELFLTPPTGAGMTAAYFAVMALVGIAGLAGIVLRYRRIAGR